MMFALALTALALTGPAVPVPVSGGTPAERAVARAVLAAADPGVAAFVRIDGRRLVVGPPVRRRPGALASRLSWEAQAVVATIRARLAARGDELQSYVIKDSTEGPFNAQSAPGVGPPGARRLRALALARAHTTGLDLRRARVLRIGGGLLVVTVRLREDQLFDSAAEGALTALFGPATSGQGPLHFLTVEAPDGTAVEYGGTFTNGGLWSFGGDSGDAPVPRALPRRLWQAHTDLVVELTRQVGLVRRRTVHIVCGGNRPPQGSRCARVLADRWALLPPTSGGVCPGPIGGWNLSVTGVFAGQAISRSYDTCHGATTGRWARFLGV
jgi:hypothetical protein